MQGILAKAGMVAAGALLTLFAGCGGTPTAKQSSEFFTSGSREADQRASQRMAREEQLTGSGEGAAEKGTKKAKPAKGGTETAVAATGRTNTAARAEEKLALYDRLGGEPGISNIVVDFTTRAMEDPRVNWERMGITRGGLSFHHNKSSTWTNSPANVEKLRVHFEQFIALATGGPSQYDGKAIKTSHADMHISNPEFDAAIGDLKATLDKLQIPNKEQKELLAIVESTRPEIVQER